jgi:hypothetical protein
MTSYKNQTALRLAGAILAYARKGNLKTELKNDTMKIENHLDVYVDDYGRVCLAQYSMDEECSVALEQEEARSLITLLTDALNEAVLMSGKRDGGKAKKALQPT